MMMDASEGSEVRLQIVAGPHAGYSAAFHAPATVVVGRGADAQLRLAEDQLISRRHFRLEIAPPQCTVKDLNSTNGTFVNGASVVEKSLQDGDEVGGGETRMRICIRRAAAGDAHVKGSGREIEATTGMEGNATSPAEPLPQLPARGSVSDRIADYTIERLIGQGATGEVYLARHMATGRDVAIKIMTTPDAVESVGMQLFLREASVLSRLKHPRIVNAIDFGIFDGRPYLVMEYIPTIEFGELLDSRTPAERTRIACWIVCQILEALQFAHDNCVVHRDVKPSNVLAYRRGRHLHVKLSDFGLAKNYLSAGFTAVSSDGDVRGTLVYMPPEQLLNCRYSKPPCDLYAAGACLYRFLYGVPPYAAHSASEAIHAILNGTLVPLGHRRPDLPQPLVAIVKRAMARKPEDRFASASRMREALLPYTEKKSSGSA